MVARRVEGTLGSKLLEASLVVLPPGPFRTDCDVVDHEIEHDFGRSCPSGINKDSAENCFERISKDRLFIATAGLVLASAEQHLWSYTDATGHHCKRCGVDDRGSELGQLALGQLGIDVVDVFSDRQPEYGVAKELEPFIRLGCIRLCAIAPMSERQLQKCGVSELVPDCSSQFLGVGRLVQESAPT